MKQDYVTKAEFSKKLNSISNSNDNITKRLDDTIMSLKKDINTMISSFGVFVQQTNDTLASIEADVNRIKEKLWPNYFYLEAINNATITVNGLGTGELKYTKTPDDESSWTTETISNGSTFNITLDAGEKCYFVGDIIPSTGILNPGTVTFVTTDPIACGGNVYYVADKNGQLSQDYQCYRLFRGCSGLTNAPELPATTLTEHCYRSMFALCSSLTSAPLLPATTLTNYCYHSMFYSSGLTNAPELPATTLAESCYEQMLSGCSRLTTVSELPATTLAEDCYFDMYAYCTSLTGAPLLPATILVEHCYYQMFTGCTQLNYVKCLATDMTATGCTTNWLQNVSSTGTFVKDANTTWSTGVDGIPSGWTIEDE